MGQAGKAGQRGGVLQKVTTISAMVERVHIVVALGLLKINSGLQSIIPRTAAGLGIFWAVHAESVM